MFIALGNEVVRFFQTRIYLFFFCNLASDSKRRYEIESSHALRAKIRAEIPGEQAEIAGTRAEIPGIGPLHFQLEFTDGESRVRTFFIEQAPFYSFRTFFLCKIGASVFYSTLGGRTVGM